MDIDYIDHWLTAELPPMEHVNAKNHVRAHAKLVLVHKMLAYNL